MNGAAVAVHAALLLLIPLAGLTTARRELSRLVWPAAGLLALVCASAAAAGSPARAILGVAIALSACGLAGGVSPVATLASAGAFVSLAVGLALGMERYTGYTLYAVGAALVVLGAAAGRVRSARAAERIAVATAAVAVLTPLLDFSARWVLLAPWATVPHALALVGLVAFQRPVRARADHALAARLERLERELGFARRAGAVALVASAAVHELKGLMTDLRVAAQYGLSSGDGGTKDRALALIADGTGRALRLLQDLQKGEREPASACAVQELLETVARWSREGSPIDAPEILLDAPAELVVMVRLGEVELALSCLARNALAAGSRRGKPQVALRAAATASGVDIEVVDEAGGLPLDLRADVFVDRDVGVLAAEDDHWKPGALPVRRELDAPPVPFRVHDAHREMALEEAFHEPPHDGGLPGPCLAEHGHVLIEDREGDWQR